MKTKIYTVIACLFLTVGVWAQAPEKMSYQAVIRDSGDALVVSTSIGMQISILQGSPAGGAVYLETQTPSTNANGLVSLEIGTGNVVFGDFTAIDWAAGPYFIKTEIDPAGGTSYTIVGTSELTSTPYALHASTAENATTADNGLVDGTATGQIQYWDGSAWVTLAPGSTGQVLTLVEGVPTWGSATSQVGTNDVQNPITGAIWMDRNLGATQVATSSTDAAAYGDLYQWGRGTDGHEKRTSATTATIASSEVPGHGDFILTVSTGVDPDEWHSPPNPNLWQGVNGINNPCPTGYRLPTETELDTERLSWNSNDAEGAFASPLKLTVGGRRTEDGSLSNVDLNGYYWTSTAGSFATSNARRMFFRIGASSMSEYSHGWAISVRCIKD